MKNNNLEQQIRELYKTWFVTFETFKNNEFIDTPFAKIPKGWSVKRLKDICDKISESYKPNAEKVVLLQSADVYKGNFINKEYVNNKNVKGHFKYKFHENDVLYSQVRPKNEHYAFVDFEPVNYIASTQLMVLRAKKGIILPYILYLILTSKYMIKQINLLAESRSGTFPQVNFNEIKNEPIIVASFEVYEDFWEIIEPMMKYQKELNNENQKLTKLRDTLLPKLMSGEIDVSSINFD